MFGMLSPASRGALMTAAIVLFMFMGSVQDQHLDVETLYHIIMGHVLLLIGLLLVTTRPGCLELSREMTGRRLLLWYVVHTPHT